MLSRCLPNAIRRSISTVELCSHLKQPIELDQLVVERRLASLRYDGAQVADGSPLGIGRVQVELLGLLNHIQQTLLLRLPRLAGALVAHNPVFDSFPTHVSSKDQSPAFLPAGDWSTK
jgi:hypothetical protein